MAHAKNITGKLMLVHGLIDEVRCVVGVILILSMSACGRSTGMCSAQCSLYVYAEGSDGCMQWHWRWWRRWRCW